MRWTAVLFCTLALACSEDRTSSRVDGGGVAGQAGGGGRAGGGGVGGGDGGSGGAPSDPTCDGLEEGTPAPFGLDERPHNATCIAPQRPSAGADVKLVRAFPALRFYRPLGPTRPRRRSPHR